MEDKKAENINPPQSLDEFILRYAPLFAAHSNELAMVIERRSEGSLHGGPGHHDPGDDAFAGRVTSTDYYLAVIDPAKSFVKNEQVTLKFPVGSTILVHLHGTHILEDREMGTGLYDLLKMEETLIDLDPVCGKVQLPQWELFVGDEEAAKALERVRNERELVGIGAAAKKLGRPITGSAVLDAACEANINVLVSMLVRSVFGPKPDKLPRPDIERCLEELLAFDIDKVGAAQRCLEQLLTELKQGLGLAT